MTFNPCPNWLNFVKSVYVNGKKVFDDDYLKSLTPLSLALWYMDDANFDIRSKGRPKADRRRNRSRDDLRRGNGSGDARTARGVSG